MFHTRRKKKPSISTAVRREDAITPLPPGDSVRSVARIFFLIFYSTATRGALATHVVHPRAAVFRMNPVENFQISHRLSIAEFVYFSSRTRICFDPRQLKNFSRH